MLLPAALPTTTPPAAPAAGQPLGSFTFVAWDDEDMFEPNEFDATFVAGRPLGNAAGYAAADEAVRAVQALSWQNELVGAVVKRDERYFGYAAVQPGVQSPASLEPWMFDSGYEPTGPNDPAALPIRGISFVRELARPTEVAAIVDGAFVESFGRVSR